MKIFQCTLLFLLPYFLLSQTIADFEGFGLLPDSVENNAGADGGFTEAGIFLNNSYFQGSGYEVWSGWSISAATDNTTPGFLNQYSAVTGGGYDNSTAYAVSYAFDPVWMRIENAAFGAAPVGLYITNGTYPFLSMRDGDAYADKFGGPTGDEPDFLKLTVRAKSGNAFTSDSVEFYLADYRFADNTQDYIVDAWTWLDLSVFGNVDSLMFSMTSSDNNSFGMVTPAYFCVDNVETMEFVSTEDANASELYLSIYPNPSSDFVFIEKKEAKAAHLEIYAADGQLVQDEVLLETKNRLSLQYLPSGVYTFLVKSQSGSALKKVIKH